MTHWLATLLRDKSIRPFAIALLLAGGLAPILIGLTTLLAPRTAHAQNPNAGPPRPIPRAAVATPKHNAEVPPHSAPITETSESPKPAEITPTPTPPTPAPTETPATTQDPAPTPEPDPTIAEPKPHGAQSVEVGFYPVTIYNLDVAANTFNANMYVWFIWSGDLDPSASFEFTNGVDASDLTKVADYEQPEQLPDGRFYQIFRVESRFFQPYDLSRFPFDEHNLSITIEDKDHVIDKLVYRPDLWQSGLGDNISIPGWKIAQWSLTTDEHHYKSNFGDPRDGAEGSTYSLARFEITIKRPLSYFLYKLFLPLVIVMLLPWGALLMPPSKVEPRTALAATGLLTAVFLQIGYATNLPDTGYLTLLDKIYLLTYVLIVTVLFEALITARWVLHDKESPESIARARRLDHRVLLLEILVFAGGVAWLIWR